MYGPDKIKNLSKSFKDFRSFLRNLQKLTGLDVKTREVYITDANDYDTL
jgi:hypothetical protein